MVDALAESVRCTVPEDLAARLYMTTDDWRRLAEGGMRVGAHGVTHRRLNQATPHELADEVAHSCSAVAGLSPTVTFAYPDGAFDEAVIDALRRAGVKSAVTCVPGSIENDVDPLLLPRSHICPS
jgi:peptidoglycan/xylan/chitin deacetylase (PgdA/CDA1 family)